MNEPLAYRLEWRPGEYAYLSQADYVRESRRDGARVRGLFLAPLPGCKEAPAVFYGWCWIEPKYAKGGICPEGFVPLYLGHVIHEPGSPRALKDKK